MRYLLVLLCALGLAACGNSESAVQSPEQPTTTTAGSVSSAAAVATSTSTPAPSFCADPGDAPPVALPLGVVTELPDNGKEHQLCSSYDHTPPGSGAHFPAWQNCGVYNVPIPNQTAVHSLEHGAVWVAYHPDLDAAAVQTISSQLASEEFALVAPYPGLQNPIVLTAWTRQLAVDDWSDPTVGEFLDQYLGRYSAVAPEAGAQCGNAIGSAPADPNFGYQAIYEQLTGG